MRFPEAVLFPQVMLEMEKEGNEEREKEEAERRAVARRARLEKRILRSLFGREPGTSPRDRLPEVAFQGALKKTPIKPQNDLFRSFCALAPTVMT